MKDWTEALFAALGQALVVVIILAAMAVAAGLGAAALRFGGLLP